MSDVLFRYLLMARDHDRSWRHRAFLNEERLLAAGLVRLTETAAIQLRIKKQFHRITRVASPIVPASRAEKVAFFDHAEPHPPPEGVLEDRVERFPLRSTLDVVACPHCKHGRRTCLTCYGQKDIQCGRCKGVGRELLFLLKCAGCEGKGRVRCSVCDNEGLITDPECAGEGRVASWETEVHEYSVRNVQEFIASPGLPAEVEVAARYIVDRFGKPLPELTPEAAGKVLGYATSDVNVLVARAQMLANVQRGLTEPTQVRCLHIVPSASAIRLSSCRVLSETKQQSGDYWLVGQGDVAREFPPAPTIDRWKAAAIPALLFGLALLRAFFAARPQSQSIPEMVTGGLLMLGQSAALFAVAAVGFRRMFFGRRSRVRTIAILPCDGGRSSYLTCLGAVGSHTGKLEVLDHTYGRDLNALMGEAQSPSHSQSIAVRTTSGEFLRLIEIARPEELTASEIARMGKAVDGIIYLVYRNGAEDALHSRLVRNSSHLPPEAVLRVDAQTTETDRRGFTSGGALAIEAIRRVFARQLHASLDWPGVFTRLWLPIGEVLRGTTYADPEREGRKPEALPSTG